MDVEVSIQDLSNLFRALGDPTRLAIFQLLRSCDTGLALDEDGGVRPFSGTTVGEVCCRVDVAQSTVSHHLKELRQAGLIRMQRQGRSVCCSVDPDALRRIHEFVTERPC